MQKIPRLRDPVAPDLDLTCRCPGRLVPLPCGRRASQEDGLCDTCRCCHGTCSDHPGFPDLVRCQLNKRGKDARYVAEVGRILERRPILPRHQWPEHLEGAPPT